MSDLFEMEIEPEPAAAYEEERPVGPGSGYDDGEFDVQSAVETVLPALTPPPMSLASVLPDGFNLLGLLQFLPDVSLKRSLDVEAAKALAIEVKGREGVQAADRALGELKTHMKAIDLCFDGTEDLPGPTALANQLHKRLTGLRADFKSNGTAAVATLSTGIALETKRLDDAAARVQREEQRKADEKVRADAARAAFEARRSQAPTPIVAALEQAAQTATAPPVATNRASAPVLAHSTVVEKQKARLFGTPEDGEPNPAVDDMNDAQLSSLRRLLRAILDGQAPLTLIEPSWPRINARAEGSALGEFLPGLEAYKARSTRGKGRR